MSQFISTKTYELLSNKLTASHATTTFTIGFVPYDELPKDVQERALRFTDNRPPDLAFLGEDQLLDQGVTSNQIPHIEDFLKKTFDKTPTTDYAINIDNVRAAPFDPNQTNPVSTYTFTAQINDITYTAILDSQPLGAMRIRLYNPEKKLVDDSGMIDTQPADGS
jgi:hypothetical protein